MKSEVIIQPVFNNQKLHCLSLNQLIECNHFAWNIWSGCYLKQETAVDSSLEQRTKRKKNECSLRKQCKRKAKQSWNIVIHRIRVGNGILHFLLSNNKKEKWKHLKQTTNLVQCSHIKCYICSNFLLLLW